MLQRSLSCISHIASHSLLVFRRVPTGQSPTSRPPNCDDYAPTQYKETELLKWMLRKGAQVTARATGAFFKGPYIIKLPEDNQEEPLDLQQKEKKPDMLQRIVEWVRKDETRGHARSRKKMRNLFSACDYGEFPLSFAASVGSVEKCQLLVEHSKNMTEDEMKKFKKHQQHVLKNLEPGCQKDRTDFDCRTRYEIVIVSVHVLAYLVLFSCIMTFRLNAGSLQLRVFKALIT